MDLETATKIYWVLTPIEEDIKNLDNYAEIESLKTKIYEKYCDYKKLKPFSEAHRKATLEVLMEEF